MPHSSSLKTVAVVVGSLRRDSINRKFAESLGRLAVDRLQFKMVEIGDLPLYNEDLWANPPAPVVRMKQEVAANDAVLFVTPEYNRFFTPAIKNVIDWGSRPRGQNVWEAKPAAIVGTTTGAIGTAAAQSALRSLVVVCDMVLMGQPEVYFTYKPEFFDEHHDFVDEKTKKFLGGWIDRFAQWIALTREPRTTAQANAV